MQWHDFKILSITPWVCVYTKDIRDVRFLNHPHNKYLGFQNAIRKHVKGVWTITIKSPNASYRDTTKDSI